LGGLNDALAEYAPDIAVEHTSDLVESYAAHSGRADERRCVEVSDDPTVRDEDSSPNSPPPQRCGHRGFFDNVNFDTPDNLRFRWSIIGEYKYFAWL
jgi:hypothetical protein